MNDLTTLNNISMTTVEIAERTGKLHKSVLRDTRVMLLKLYDKKDEHRFVLTYKDVQGKDRPCYLLPKREVLILISGYSIPLRAKIIDRLNELETKDNIILHGQKFIANELEGLLEIGELFEIPKHLAQIEAVKRIKIEYNVDLSTYLIEAPAQNNIKEEDVMLEPTELGKLFDLSGAKMNKKLKTLGLQFKGLEGWIPTKKGKKISSKHSWSSGSKSGYNYKWNLKAIKKLMN